jgi:hypothetical protein
MKWKHVRFAIILNFTQHKLFVSTYKFKTATVV